jgi:hypothetical protein
VGQQLGRRSTGAGFIAADLQAADREAQTLVAGLSEQQMNCLHHVESLQSTIFAAISSVSYQEPPVSVWCLSYFLDPHNRVVVRLPGRDVYLFTRKKATAFGPVDLEVARLHLVDPGPAEVASYV